VSVPSDARNGKHFIRLQYKDEKNGTADRKELSFLVKNEGGWDRDATAEALKAQHPAVVLLQDGLPCPELGIGKYDGLKDTYLYSTHPVEDRNSDYVNYGACDYFFIGKYAYKHRAMFKIDLSAIPKDAVVEQACLKLFIFDKRGKGPTIEAFEVLKDWNPGRGVGMWAPRGVKWVADGEASWLCNAHPAKWDRPGCDAPGSDRSEKPVGAAQAPAANKTWVQVDLDKEVVQRWIRDPAANRGLILIDRNEMGDFSSSFRSCEYADPPFRPRMVLAFSKGVRATTPK